MLSPRIGATVALGSLLSMFSQLAAAGVAGSDCGVAVSPQGPPKASDALGILRTAVGSRSCDLCVCDVDRSGKTTASDALATLKAAVGQNVDLRCVACAVTQTIGSAGGTITSGDGRVEIEFPPGALEQDTEITVAGLATSLLDDAFDEAGIVDAYQVEPNGLVLNLPAIMKVNADAVEVEDGIFEVPVETLVAQDDSETLQARAEGGTAGSMLYTLPGESTFQYDDREMQRQAETEGVRWFNIRESARVRLRVPQPVTVDTTVLVHVEYLPRSVSENDFYSGHYEDTAADHFKPVAGLPLITPTKEVEGSGQVDLLDYTCDSVGFHDYRAKVVLEGLDLSNDVPGFTETVHFDATVRCTGPTVLRTGLEFTDSCIGMLFPFGNLPPGIKIVCTGGDDTVNGVRIMAPQPDPNDTGSPPLAQSLLTGIEDAPPTFKVVLLPAPGDSLNDAVLSAGVGAQLWRFDPQSGTLQNVFPTLQGFHNFADISAPVQLSDPPSALMLDTSTRTFSLFPYDGSDEPNLPQVLVASSAFDDVDILGGLKTGKLKTAAGPLLGATSGNGVDPGTIFFHDLSNPEAKVTVVGDGGVLPNCIHCDAALCVLTNGGDDTMTVIDWSGPGTPTILGTVPIGDEPNGAAVFPLGGTRHFVVSVGRGDDSFSLTILDTGAQELVESNVKKAVPEGCDSPTFVHPVGTDSVVISCTGNSRFVFHPGLVPSQ